MSLKHSAASGVKWMGLSRAIITAIEFIRLTVLAHLLSPDDFGLLGMLMVVSGFALCFADMGFSNAIIYHQDSNDDQLSSIYWLTIITGVVIFFLVWLASPLIIDYYNEPRLSNLIFWIALSFLVTPIGQQYQMLLQKELKFDCLAKIETVEAVIGTLLAILLALMGFGVYSLIWGILASSLARALLLIRGGWNLWRPKLHFNKDEIKGYISFGLYQMGEHVVNYFSANVDYLIIGRYLGSKILGFYTVAYRLVVMPLSKFNPTITRVAFPVFSKRQSDDISLRIGYLKMIKLIALTMFPVLIGLGVTAPLIVPIFLGEGWAPATYIIQILVLLGMLKTIVSPVGSIILAKGRADIGFKVNVFIAIVNTLVFLYAVRYGVYAIAWSFVFLCVIFFIMWLFILRHVIGIRCSEYLSVLIRPTVIGSVMGFSVFFVYYFILSIASISISKIPSLITLVMTGISIYGLLALIFERSFLMEMGSLIIKGNRE